MNLSSTPFALDARPSAIQGSAPSRGLQELVGISAWVHRPGPKRKRKRKGLRAYGCKGLWLVA
eukprot:5198280-Prymnesium_polylepis.1